MRMNITLSLSFSAFFITSLLLSSTAEGQRSGISLDAPATSAASEQRGGTVIKNQVEMEFVYVPAGNFMMGSTDAAVHAAYKQAQIDVGPDHAKLEWFTREQPRHRVTIPKGFYMGRYEVTQAQWQAVMKNNPSQFKGCDQCPVEQVSWNDSQEFIRRLNAMDNGFRYSLPSEAQWEYACRAGTATEFAFGNSLSSVPANFDGNYPYAGAAKGVNRQKTTPVGSFQSNAWGLYDMHGNVWEWCEDVWHENYDGAPADGSPWLSGGDSKYRVERGGSWDFHGDALRSAYRFSDKPDDRVNNSGLRVVAVSRSS